MLIFDFIQLNYQDKGRSFFLQVNQDIMIKDTCLQIEWKHQYQVSYT